MTTLNQRSQFKTQMQLWRHFLTAINIRGVFKTKTESEDRKRKHNRKTQNENTKRQHEAKTQSKNTKRKHKAKTQSKNTKRKHKAKTGNSM